MATSSVTIRPSLDKFEYQPLNTERSDLRLVYFTSSCIPISSNGETENSLESIISVKLKTVSTHDYSEDSRTWMKGNDKSAYLFMEYVAANGAMGSKESPTKTKSGQSVEDAIEEMLYSPEFGRWT